MERVSTTTRVSSVNTRFSMNLFKNCDGVHINYQNLSFS